MANKAEMVGAGSSGPLPLGFLSLLPSSAWQLCPKLRKLAFESQKILGPFSETTHSSPSRCSRPLPDSKRSCRDTVSLSYILHPPPPQACRAPTQQKSCGGHRRPGNQKSLSAAGNIEPTEVPTYSLFGLCLGFLEWVTKRKIKNISTGDGGMNWEIGIDIYTLICIKWITNKNLLYKKYIYIHRAW